MDPSTVLLVVAAALVVAAVLVVRRLALFPLRQARELLARGATVIDVRSPEEFNAGHVSHAINVPLDTLTERIQAVVNDQDAPVLLHCVSGGRSALAQRRLRGLGYSRVYQPRLAGAGPAARRDAALTSSPDTRPVRQMTWRFAVARRRDNPGLVTLSDVTDSAANTAPTARIPGSQTKTSSCSSTPRPPLGQPSFSTPNAFSSTQLQPARLPVKPRPFTPTVPTAKTPAQIRESP